MDLITSKNQTMSLKEITDLINVRHDKAFKKVESMATNPEFGAVSKMDIVYNDAGQTVETFVLDQRQSVAVASRLNVALLMRVIDRWQELENKEKFNVPETLPDALQLAADLALKIEQDKPKIEVYELLADRKGDVSTTILAKQLGTTAIKLNRWLRDKGIKWQQADLPKAGYQDYFNTIADVKNGHEFTQCLVTPHGQIKISEKWAKDNQQ